MSVIEGFGGTVVLPTSADYDGARAVWNAMHDRRPALIARPRNPREVAVAIRHARAPRSDDSRALRRPLDARPQCLR